jgi:hypothetical protein
VTVTALGGRHPERPSKGWFIILHLYSPLEPFFTQQGWPNEIERQPWHDDFNVGDRPELSPDDIKQLEGAKWKKGSNKAKYNDNRTNKCEPP